MKSDVSLIPQLILVLSFTMSAQPFVTLYDIRDSSQSNGWIPSIWRIRQVCLTVQRAVND